jgi:hypothetical protein
MNRDQAKGDAEATVDEAGAPIQETCGDVKHAARKTAADVRREWREARKSMRAPRPGRSAKR